MPNESARQIFLATDDSALAKRSWAGLTGRNRNGKEKSCNATEAGPKGFSKGMALLFAEDYARLKSSHPTVVALSRAASVENPNDGLQCFRESFLQIGLDVAAGGVPTLRALYVLLYELGIRETDGRFYLGLDTGPNKPNEPIDAETTEAGLFSSSWNASYGNSLARAIYDTYKPRGEGAGAAYVSVFREGLRVPSHRREDDIGTGEGNTFQRLTKANPRFATEFAAAVTRQSGYENYFYIQFGLMEIAKESISLLHDIERIVDKHGPPQI